MNKVRVHRGLALQELCFGLVLFLVTASGSAQVPHRDQNQTEHRIDSILNQMTVEEKIDLLGGINFFDIRGIPRVGLPLLGTADGPVGVRNDGPATVMAGGISLAATWNRELAEQVGKQIGRDARAKGKYFLLGPGVNIYRSPLNGRNFEYFGEDPFLASRIAVGYIRGVQSEGVSATVKHFLGNNSEFGRNSTDSVIDERTLREIYLPSFEAAVKEAHVGAIMDSYNLTNGEYMTQNGYLNNDVVKKDWGFRGIVMSDWGATHDTLGAFNGGLDLEMWSGEFLNRNTLLPAIEQGKITTATLDDKVRRIVRTEIEFGGLDREPRDFAIPRYNQQGRQVALQAAREGMVLLKNEGSFLPLNEKTITTVAVIGPDAYPAVPVGGGSAQAVSFHAVSFLEGISDHLGTAASVTYDAGLPTLGVVANRTSFSTEEAHDSKPGLTTEVFDNADLSGPPASTRVDQHINISSSIDLTALSSGEVDFTSLLRSQPSSTRWTGYYVPEKSGTYDFFIQQGGFGESGFRLYVDGALVRDRWTFTIAIVDQFSLSLTAGPHKVVFQHHAGAGLALPRVRLGIMPQGSWVSDVAKKLAAKADVVVVAAGFNPESESEGWDRTFALPPGQDELIQQMAAANKKTIVVVTSGGGVDVRPWIDKIPGLLEAWYPGQEGGTALAEILFGETNPSGHLPATFEKQWEDNPAHDNYYPGEGSNKIEYKEGVFVGYRGYEDKHIKPQFPFGFGLSYTTFKYANLVVTGGATSPGYVVSFDVTNTGKLAGAAVAQLYISDTHADVPRPAKELKGFTKVFLKPGETRKISIPLSPRSFSYYDIKAKQWHAHSGPYGVLVGSSSADIALRGEVALARDVLSE